MIRAVIQIICTVILFIGLVLLGGAILSLGGCSAKGVIQKAATKASQKAASVATNLAGASENLRAAKDTGDVGPKATPFIEAAEDHIDAAKEDNAAVIQAASDVTGALPGVEDKDGFFEKVLKAGGLLFAAFILIYCAPFIRPVIIWIGAKIGIKSKATVMQAKADAEWEKDPTPLDPTDIPAIKAQALREYTDPAYRMELAKNREA